jgi:hypothetical protein
MAEMEIGVDTASFYRKVDEFARQWGLDARTVMKNQHMLFCKDLQRWTPAARKGGVPGGRGGGKDPIERDIGKVFVQARDIAAIKRLREVSDKMEHGEGRKWFRPEMDAGEMARIHKGARGRRGGVSARPGKFNLRFGPARVVTFSAR